MIEEERPATVEASDPTQPKTAAETLPQPEPCPGVGMAPGINIEAGSDDDGWTVPDPVILPDGTRLQLYKDGEALRAAHEAILAATKRICLEVYIFADDDTGHAFAEALARKAREGVKVYVIYDSFGSRGIGPEPAMFGHMRRNGVNVQQFHPMRPWECQYSWRFINRDHRKLLLVDDDIAGLGGLNVGAEYAGSWVVSGSKVAPCDQWRDNAVGIRGPGAFEFRRAFANTWNYVTHGGRIRRAFYEQNLDSGDLGVLASVPTLDSPLRPALIALMRSAQKNILMTMAYFAPDDGLVKELCRAARRGVRVRLMLPGRSDVPGVRATAQSYYELLLSYNIEIYERQAVILHAKTMVVDDHTTVIGSTNLDYRSIEYNCEISAILRNDTFGQQMHLLFDHDVRYARKIDPAAWRRRPLRDRFVQWAVSQVRNLM